VGWRAYLTADDEDVPEQVETVLFCPECSLGCVGRRAVLSSPCRPMPSKPRTPGGFHGRCI